MTSWTPTMVLGVGGLGAAAAAAPITTCGAFRASRAERQRPLPGDSIVPLIERIHGVLARLPRPLLRTVASVRPREMQVQRLRGVRRRTGAG